ncbi:MAG TPA: sulfatase-like hydrolase/transferase, partial [Anaerolineales bacterium]|nr:sulfatase-like hydrolase/transferase [Anaerolineales bacterium]
YGHIYISLKGVNVGGFYLFRHRTLVPVWFGLGVLTIWWASRKSLRVMPVSYALNVVALFLVILPTVQLISSFIQSRASQTSAENNASGLNLQVGSQPPDIYYIILDGYGRADVLENEYGYDNSDFLDSLRDLGFTVADCSLSNYAQTQMSLASSLNFDYIDALSDRFVAGSEDRTGLDALIQHGAARLSLEKAGYKTVAFATGFLATEWTDADYFLGPGYSWGQLNEFEALLVETTLARLIQDGNRFGMQTSGSERFRERTLFTLDTLDELSYIQGPKFVFVHIIAPHPPYVFGPTGGPVAAADAGTTRTQEGASHYRDQAIYISSRMMEIVPQIIANSDTPPIIVIQGDHGPTVPSNRQGRMSILNAYYLPGVDASIPETITPANTFRIIFNEYFGQDLELLDDVSLYSDYDDPFNWKVVPNSCNTSE